MMGAGAAVVGLGCHLGAEAAAGIGAGAAAAAGLGGGVHFLPVAWTSGVAGAAAWAACSNLLFNEDAGAAAWIVGAEGLPEEPRLAAASSAAC